MRDVTDNVTGDLPGVEMKRGRGRPRKAHAMTNAERQAAFRARRKAEQPSDRSVTVTKKVAEVDAYDDCQEQVDALRFELAETVQAHNQVVAQLDEARREKDIAWRVMREKRDRAEELEREVLQLKKRLLQEKSVTPSNENLAEIEALRRQLVTCEDGRQEALRYAGALEEKVAAFESQQNPLRRVTEIPFRSTQCWTCSRWLRGRIRSNSARRCGSPSCGSLRLSVLWS